MILAGSAGLCTTGYPEALISHNREGSTSPVMIIAGTCLLIPLAISEIADVSVCRC